MTRPLLVTRDETLLDELLRLAAAAGVTPDVAPDAGAALRGWAAAALVLVGSDTLDDLVRLSPPRRPGVHVVAFGGGPPGVYRDALAVGAESVVDLPAGGEWLVESLTDLGEQPAGRGLLVAVTGGSGGAGATTFACALGQVAASDGSCVVVDLDPLGPGVDRVLGLEGTPGVRWGDLCRTSGRLGARSLREALPGHRTHGPAALAWGGTDRAPESALLDPTAVREALSAAVRGHDTVVVDLSRARDAVADEVAARCHRVLVVTRPDVTGCASAVRVCDGFSDRSRLGLVVRGRGVRTDDLARVAGVPVLGTMADQRGLAEAVDLGLGPVRSHRGPLGRAARQVLAIVRSGRGEGAAA